MRQILVYSDSASWGIVPSTRKRQPFEARWPGVMEIALNEQGQSVRVIEDCLNGRRTVWEDPFKPGRNGLVGPRSENRDQFTLGFGHAHAGHQRLSVDASAQCRTCCARHRGPRRGHPPSAHRAGHARPADSGHRAATNPRAAGPIATKFTGAAEKSAGLSDAYRAVAAELGCHFFDAGSVTSASAVDGIHLDADQHQSLGKALAHVVAALPGVLPPAMT